MTPDLDSGNESNVRAHLLSKKRKKILFLSIFTRLKQGDGDSGRPNSNYSVPLNSISMTRNIISTHRSFIFVSSFKNPLTTASSIISQEMVLVILRCWISPARSLVLSNSRGDHGDYQEEYDYYTLSA